jgi:hypothetical protein
MYPDPMLWEWVFINYNNRDPTAITTINSPNCLRKLYYAFQRLLFACVDVLYASVYITLCVSVNAKSVDRNVMCLRSLSTQRLRYPMMTNLIEIACKNL